MTLKKFGLLKTTLIDYPGEVASTIFTPGCNLTCPYCHNIELIKAPFPDDLVSYGELMSFLNKRKNVLGGVCITGGEPLINSDLNNLIDAIHELGLKVKLDTNGTFPEALKKTKADYIAMDIKTSLNKYQELTSSKIENLSEKIKESIKIIMSLNLPYEFRTTVVPGLVDDAVIDEIINLIKGSDNYVLAQYRPAKTLDPSYSNINAYPVSVLEGFAEKIRKAGITCKIRSN